MTQQAIERAIEYYSEYKQRPISTYYKADVCGTPFYFNGGLMAYYVNRKRQFKFIK